MLQKRYSHRAQGVACAEKILCLEFTHGVSELHKESFGDNVVLAFPYILLSTHMGPYGPGIFSLHSFITTPRT